MWTRSATNKKTGMITVIVTDWNGETFATGEFSDLNEANKFGEDAERRMTAQMQAWKNQDQASIAEYENLSDDELLNELKA